MNFMFNFFYINNRYNSNLSTSKLNNVFFFLNFIGEKCYVFIDLKYDYYNKKYYISEKTFEIQYNLSVQTYTTINNIYF